MGAQMSFAEFLQSTTADTPPAELDGLLPGSSHRPARLSGPENSANRENPQTGRQGRLPLLALWLDAKGRWDAAHEAAQAAGGREGAWVHAYLHRKEGDEMNAGYWYARAGRPAASGELREEWETIARELLG
jgi:hypothetical protein